MCKNGVISHGKVNLFPTKIPNDLNQCPIKVGARPAPPFVIPKNRSKYSAIDDFDLSLGMEMKLLDTVAWRANFKPVLNSVALQDTNDKFADVYLSLKLKQIDLAIGTISPAPETHAMFDFSVQYAQDQMTWIVPADEMLPKWLGIIMIYELPVWIATFAMLLLILCIMQLVIKCIPFNFKNEHNAYRNTDSLLFILFGILFMNVPTRTPNTTILKSVLMFWLLFCLLWSIAYNGLLKSVLTSPVFKADVILNPNSNIFDSN